MSGWRWSFVSGKALTLFAENGYDGTSVEQIASIVGIKAPSLYKHFKGKEDIGTVSIICFVIALVFFVLFVMSDKPEFSNTIINNEGLWERLNLIFMYAPLLVVSIRQIIKG